MSISDTSVMSTSWREMPPIHNAIKDKNWTELEKLLAGAPCHDLMRVYLS